MSKQDVRKQAGREDRESMYNQGEDVDDETYGNAQAQQHGAALSSV